MLILQLTSVSPSTSSSRSLPPSSIAETSEPLIVAFRSAFNATAPANHLPSELVIEILSSGSWDRWQELVILTHICQHWRTVALGTPQLWAEAIRSMFTGQCRRCQCGNHMRLPKCLPAFLMRSEPFPLSIDFPDYMRLVAELQPSAVLKPHAPRLAHLSVEVNWADGVKTVLELVHVHIRNLESLHIRMPQGQDQLSGAPFAIDNLPSWEDADLPRLHILAIPGYYFDKAIAVASLKTLVLYKGPRNYKVFLDALERCGPSLESLALHDWTHFVPRADASSSTTRTVQLPKLRRLKLAISSTSSNAAIPALLFATLSFPPTVTIDLGWNSNPGNTRELLPKDLVGLHAPPFFDSMCLHLFGSPLVASLHCYLSDTERLCVQGQVTADPSGLSFGGSPQAHRWPTVTQLAIDLDMQSPNGDAPLAQGHLLRTFMGGFPNLRRLDLLGKTIGDTKLQMVDAFLDPVYSPSPSDTALIAEKTLAYVCSVPEHAKLLRSVGIVDDFRAQLDELEALLASRLAAGGPRVHRLELCIAYSSHAAHPPPSVYPRVREISFSTVLTAYLSSIYLPRFGVLVDEVVFIGDSKARVPGYRVVSRGARQLSGSIRSDRGEKRAMSGRKGR